MLPCLDDATKLPSNTAIMREQMVKKGVRQFT